MTAITKFRIGAARTINLGNYESLRIEASLVVTVKEGEDFGAAKLRAQTKLNTLLCETYLAQNKAKTEKAP